MSATKEWIVEIHIDEHEEHRRTLAEARLRRGDRVELRGIGTAQRNPHDPEVPAIGDELAVSRALGDLARRLREIATDDIERLVSADSAG
jgi:hypothetical protein